MNKYRITWSDGSITEDSFDVQPYKLFELAQQNRHIFTMMFSYIVVIERLN